MTDRDDCLSDILKSIHDRRDRKYVADRLDDLDGRASMDSGSGSYREKLGRAAEEMLREDAVHSAVRRRNVRLDALKARDGRALIDSARENGVSSRKALEAILHGVNEQFFDSKSRRGNRLSAEATGLATLRRWLDHGFDGDLRRAGEDDPKFQGLDKLYASRQIERDIFIEKGELDAGPAGRPGKTKNEQAMKIAEIMVKWDKVEMESLNREGAWITARQRHVAEVTHDPDRMRRASNPFQATRPQNYIYRGYQQADRDKWVADTLGLINPRAMFGARADEAADILAQMYGGIIRGTGDRLSTVAEEAGSPNIAASVSTPRAFVFKNTEAQLEYMAKYGRYDPTQQWIQTKRKAAMQYGLMKTLGSEPKLMFDELISYAKNREGAVGREAERAELDAWAPKRDTGRLWHRYAAVSGESDRPIANMANDLIMMDLAIQRTAKLGTAVLAMLADNATISRELGRQGLSYAERNASILTDYFRGASDSEKARVADLLATGISGRRRGGSARFDPTDAQAGTMAALDHAFFKYSGFTAVTENKRASAERMMARHLGMQKGKEWVALGDAEQRMLGAFGIGDREWALLNQAEWHTIEGKAYLTPDVAETLSDDAVRGYLSDRQTISERATAGAPMTPEAKAAASKDALDRAREDLGLSLWAYFVDRGQHAVIEVGARERAILYRGTQSGDALNLALRLMLQFKQFPTAMITRAWGAEIYGGAAAERGYRGSMTSTGKLAGITELVVASTFMGILTNMLNDVVKGQDPISRWRNEPIKAAIAGFTRGGGGSIYGDFLFGEFSRFGLPASSTLIGPTFGQIDRFMEFYSDITHPTGKTGIYSKPSAAGSLALKMARDNTPFANMVYTKAAMDYLVLYNLQEWMNPGYLERFERGQKERNGIEFWLKPTQVNRDLRAATR